MSHTPQRSTHTVSHLGAASSLVFALMLAACGGDPVTVTDDPALVPVASVTVSPAVFTVESGRTRTLTVTVRDAAGNVLTDRTVRWGSSNLDCVVFQGDRDGYSVVMYATGPPGATITATVEGISGTADITVVGPHLPPPHH